MYIVYKTTNILNGRIYIGIHKQIDNNFDGYLGSGILLNIAINKYGIENFKRETLFTFETLSEAKLKEKELVNEDFCKSEETYNISIGGTGGNTMAGHTEEVKLLQREKRYKTNIERCNFTYTGDKLIRAIKRMKQNRIQPNNKNRKHNELGLNNMRLSFEKRIGKFIWITNGIDSRYILKNDYIPMDWYIGRSTKKFNKHSEDSKNKISKTLKEYICYNNGIKNLKIKYYEIPPIGFIKGMIQKHNKKWITNGLETKQIKKETIIPNGWKLGRTMGNYE